MSRLYFTRQRDELLIEVERKGQPGLLQAPRAAQESAEKAMERTREGVWGEMKQLLGFLIGGKWHHGPQYAAARKCKSGNL